MALDPLSEVAQRALMRAYARAGRRGEALRQYKSCEQTLKCELGVAPDAETQALASEIAAPSGDAHAYGVRGERDRVRHGSLAHTSGASRMRVPGTGIAKPSWPCLLPSVAVSVAPVRNLTSDPAYQQLAEAFADDLVTDLLRGSRGSSFKPLAAGRVAVGKVNGRQNPEPECDYVVSGSVQRTSGTTLRLNMRISDAASAEYVWAGRHEFRPEDLAPVQTKLTRRISRELNVLLLQAASRRALPETGMEHGVTECLSRAQGALHEGMRAELSAEAQRWFLKVLENDPRNVDALIGLAMTCQHLVSNPWWGDPQTVAAAADLGRQAVTIALSIAPGNSVAHCVKGCCPLLQASWVKRRTPSTRP